MPRINFVLWILACAVMFGQAPVDSLTFEVASVKPSPPLGGGPMLVGTRGGPGTVDPGQITSSNATLKNLLMVAYDVQPYQVIGPAWLNSERFNIVAKVPPGTTKEQARIMWQNLLAERFGVMLHRESKEFQVEELVIGKGGSKLKEAIVDPNAPAAPPLPGPPKMDKNGIPEINGPGMINMIKLGANGLVATTVAKAQGLSQLAIMLGNQLPD